MRQNGVILQGRSHYRAKAIYVNGFKGWFSLKKPVLSQEQAFSMLIFLRKMGF